jgi:hypothetical protein
MRSTVQKVSKIYLLYAWYSTKSGPSQYFAHKKSCINRDQKVLGNFKDNYKTFRMAYLSKISLKYQKQEQMKTDDFENDTFICVVQYKKG